MSQAEEQVSKRPGMSQQPQLHAAVADTYQPGPLDRVQRLLAGTQYGRRVLHDAETT